MYFENYSESSKDSIYSESNESSYSFSSTSDESDIFSKLLLKNKLILQIGRGKMKLTLLNLLNLIKPLELIPKL